MELVKYWVLYKQDYVGQYSIALVVAPVAFGDNLVGEMMVKRGYSNARFFSDPTPQLICEGDTSHLELLDGDKKDVSVTYFNKHKSVAYLKTSYSSKRPLGFRLLSMDNVVLGEGEI